MTADTPTPYTPPDGVILTTMGEARRIGHGETRPSDWPPADNIDWMIWSARSSESSDTQLVWWRPTPERTVTVELTQTELLNLAETPGVGGPELEKIEAALAQLDGES